MNEGYSPMPSAKKKTKPGVAKRVSDRKAFVSEKKASKGITDKQANQRFFVQTRMAEMKAKGKTVTPEMRKQLQQKFQSGNVARKGFGAPKKKAVSSSSTTTTTKPTVTTTTKPTVTSSSTTSTSTPKVQPRTSTEGKMGSRISPKIAPKAAKPGYGSPTKGLNKMSVTQYVRSKDRKKY